MPSEDYQAAVILWCDRAGRAVRRYIEADELPGLRQRLREVPSATVFFVTGEPDETGQVSGYYGNEEFHEIWWLALLFWLGRQLDEPTIVPSGLIGPLLRDAYGFLSDRRRCPTEFTWPEGDDAQAKLASACRQSADALGYLLRLLESIEAADLDETSENEPSRDQTPSITSEEADGTPASSDYILREEGDYWRLVYAGTTLLLKRNKGVRYIAHLLGNRGQEFHVFALAHLFAIPPELATVSDDERQEHGLSSGALQDSAPILDEETHRNYERRYRELQDEQVEAEALNDEAMQQRVSAESEALEKELGASLGLGGRDRKLGDIPEKARKAVCIAISRALKGIERGHKAAWLHLGNSIRTGMHCSYQPESAIPWQL